MFSAETINIITRTAQDTEIEPAALLAVIEVESGGRVFADIQGKEEPLIRFEAHYFDRRLAGADRKRAREVGLASPTAGAIRNPHSQAARWQLLERAAEINRQAAYESTSWGVGQVMGAHWAWLGFSNIDAFVKEARRGLEGQLVLMMRYIEKAGLLESLQHRDWPKFARGYNGPDFARKNYHLRLSLAYRRNSRGIATPNQPKHSPSGTLVLRRGDRGEAVRKLQRLLCAAGYPVAIDGRFGPETHEAITRIQRERDLAVDGIFGPRTRSALETALPLHGAAQAGWRALRKLWPHSFKPWNV